ncbi:MAG: phage portal protein [Oscillospiraceae bacterium]|nr:phage portal protein [Oscillospiraceae bacterium]MBR2422023.1 phage portal protein [Oscillospiraceae bacterium]
MWARVANRSPTTQRTAFKMVAIDGDSLIWNDNVYKSDIVMSAIRPYVHAIGKAVAKHIQETYDENGERQIKVNPEPYIRFLLEEPNPLLTGQKLQEWMAATLKINNHCFTLIVRDENGLPTALYPINAVGAVAEYDDGGRLYIRFYMPKGQQFVFAYTDLIHLWGDPQTGGDFFGGSKVEQLLPLMEQIGTIDKGIVAAIKNGAIIRWLLKFSNSLRPADLKDRAKEFADQFLQSDSGFGVAAVDSKSEAVQIKPTDYVPNSAQTDRIIKRFYAAVNTNEKIVTSAFTEDDWNAYYESEVEPDIIQIGNEYTRKLFSRKKRSYGNYIMLEANNLATASMATKLALREMVDRGAMTPNEWRKTFNRAPLPGGDKPIRRLDTAVVSESEGTVNE